MSGDSFHLEDYDDDGDGPKRKKKKGSSLPPLPEEGAPPEDFAIFLTDFARLGNDPVVSANRWGIDSSTPIDLTLRSGRRIQWAEQDELFGPRLQRPFVTTTGFKPRSLSAYEVQLVAWAIIQFATLRANVTEADELRELWHSYRQDRQEVTMDLGDELMVRETLHRWRQLADARSEERPFILIDSATQERWVRRLDFALHVRSIRKGPISWQRLNGLARQNGWELTRKQYRATIGSEYVDAKVFVVAADWGQGDA